MFCCNSKDDGGSPVKKSKKVAAVNSVAKKEEGLKIIPLEPVKPNQVPLELSDDQVKPEANTKVNETAEDAPTEKGKVNGVAISEVPTSKLEDLKTPEEKKDLEGTLDADEFESLVQVYKKKEIEEFK